MNEAKDSLLVEATPEAVFARLDDHEQLARIVPRLRLEPAEGEEPRGLGARLGARWDLLPGGVVRVEGKADVVRHFYPERFEIALEADTAWRFTLGRVGESTLVELRQTFQLPGGRVGHLLGNALALALRLDAALTLRRLKELCEADA